MLWVVVVAVAVRAACSETFGLSSFKPLDGDKAENRWDEVDVELVTLLEAETEPVEDLRSPAKEDNDSRLLFLGRTLELTEEPIVERRAGLVAVDGEPRADLVVTVFPELSPFSMTPNSLIVGEGLVEEVLDALTLERRGTMLFMEGEARPDVRLEIRGIFVGVSFGKPAATLLLSEEGAAPSLKSLDGMVPTDGEPAMVGS